MTSLKMASDISRKKYNSTFKSKNVTVPIYVMTFLEYSVNVNKYCNLTQRRNKTMQMLRPNPTSIIYIHVLLLYMG